MPTTLDPRPSPAQVRAWLATDLSDAALRALVAVLGTDPNWRLRASPGPATWDADLRYSPQDLRTHVHLVRRPPSPTTPATLWHRVPLRLRHRLDAADTARPGHGPLSSRARTSPYEF